MKKGVVGLLLVVMVVSVIVGGRVYAEDSIMASQYFSDVIYNDWYEANLNEVLARGIIEGYPDGTFRGEETMAVDQFIKTMVVAIDGEQPLGTSYWAGEYIAKAEELGIITTDMFSDYEKTITRAEMAAIAENTVRMLDGDYTYGYTGVIPAEIGDMTAVTASGYEASIINMYEQGILKGYPDGEYKPNDGLKRQEAIIVILRVIDDKYRVTYDYYDQYPEEIQEIIEALDLKPMQQTETGILVTPENISTLPNVSIYNDFVYLENNITITVRRDSIYSTEGDYYLDVAVGMQSIYDSEDPEAMYTYKVYMLEKILKDFARLEDDAIQVITDRFEEMYADYVLYKETGEIVHYYNEHGYTEVQDSYGRTMIIFDHKRSNTGSQGFSVRGLWEEGHPYSETW